MDLNKHLRIVQLSNMGVSFMHSMDFIKAGQCFRESLEEAFIADIKPSSITPFEGTPTLEESTMSQPNKLGCFQNIDYDEGMSMMCKPIIIYTQSIPLQEIEPTILFNLALVYAQFQNDKMALSLLSQALDLLMKSGTKSLDIATCTTGVNVHTVLRNIGYLQYRSKLYDDARRTYAKILQNMSISFSHDPHYMLETSTILNCLGVVHHHLKDFDSALAFYNESLTIRRAVLGLHCASKELATTLNNMGRAQHSSGSTEEAMAMYFEALTMRRLVLGDDHIDVAATLHNLGDTYRVSGKLVNAMESYGQFLCIATKHFGPVRRDVATTLRWMARMQQQTGQNEQATMLYQEALAILKAVYANIGYHPDIADILDDLGNLFYQRNDCDNAIRIYEEQLRAQYFIFGELHPNIIPTLTSLGQIHKRRGDYKKAVTYHLKAVKVQHHNFGMSKPNISRNLSSIGLIHFVTHDYQASIKFYKQALKIRLCTLGNNNSEVASTWDSIGMVLLKLGQYEDALHSFQECLRIRHTLLDDNIGTVLYNIAAIYGMTGRDDEALRIFHETLQVEKKTLGSSHNDLIVTMQRIGRTYHQRGDLDDAIKFFTQSLELQKQHEENNGEMAENFIHIGNIYLQKGLICEAHAAFSDAIRKLRLVGKDETDIIINGVELHYALHNYPASASAA